MLLQITGKMGRIAILLLCIGIAGGCYWYFYDYDPLTESELSEVSDRSVDEPTEEAASEAMIAVHVSGAVRKPDQVFYLEEGCRIIDAIRAAGDALEEADLSQLNLAQVLQDGEKIYVPCKGEELAEEDAVHIQDIVENPQNPLTNINLATTIELQELPGIGEAYAKRIVEYREANGNFKAIEDIKNVSGIGDSTFEKIKDSITVSP